MNSDKEIKEIVKQKYGQIAAAKPSDQPSCCGSSGSCCEPLGGVNFSDSYTGLDGYTPDADLGLGCGLPTQSSGILPGQTVLDLGSGAGNDAFVARSLVGDEGRVLGLDFSPEMVAKAQGNLARLGYRNVEFLEGEIEAIPLDSGSVDVVISNCVLNLVPDKSRAYAEIFRVLRPGAHFSISDVVLEGKLPEGLAKAATLYAGCVAGAMVKEDYFQVIRDAGFEDLKVHKLKPISVPEELLNEHLSPEELEIFHQGNVGIFSVTVSGRRP